MIEQLYFDDPDIGPSRDTSHPAFVRACEDELFYDCTDDFGPFGNDLGADVLYELEDWYREGAKRPIRSFLDFVLEKWDASIPDLAATDRDTVNKWLENEELAANVVAVGNVVIATALGQAKITGNLDAGVAELARAALDRETIVIDHYVQRAPDWPHAATARAARESMRGALARLNGS